MTARRSDFVFWRRVRLRSAPAPALPKNKIGACRAASKPLQNQTSRALKSVTYVLGRKCYPCARTHILNSSRGYRSFFAQPPAKGCEPFGFGDSEERITAFR